MKQVGFLWNTTVVVGVDMLSSTSVDFIRSERELKNCTYMGSNRLTEHAQSLLGGVKRENLGGRGKLGSEKIIIKLIKLGDIFIDLPF